MSIELLCKSIDYAGTKPGLCLSENAVGFAGAIIGNRKLPIRAGHIVGYGDLALVCFVESVLETIDNELGDNQSDALALRLVDIPPLPVNLIEISRLSLTMDCARALQSVER